MPLTTCFSCGLVFSHIEPSCPHCARRTKGGVLRVPESVYDSLGHRRMARVASLVIPGTGQIYRCKHVEGLVWFAATVAGYFTHPLLGVAIHAACTWHAGSRSGFAVAHAVASRSVVKPNPRSFI